MPDHLAILVDAALRGAGIALFATTGALFLRDRPDSTLARVGAVFAVGLVVQLASSSPPFEASVPLAWQAPLVAVSVANGVLFWIFVQALFDDDFAVRPLHGATWLAVAALAGYNCASGWHDTSLVGRLAIAAQRVAPLIFAILAVAAAAARWRQDLVESRRRLRAWIVGSGSAYSVAMVVLRLASPHGRLDVAASTFDAAATAGIGVIATLAFAGVRRSELVVPEAAAPKREPTRNLDADDTAGETANDGVDDANLVALERAMREEHAYRDEGMTVAALASRLALPEYRLRRLINRRLGHRNFNAFINGYRLTEAREALSDPAKRQLPVLTIALTAGFESIGPFNRAFKAETGVTPSEYRRRSLADS
jgi:AraC-like DNA-binding protein